MLAGRKPAGKEPRNFYSQRIHDGDARVPGGAGGEGDSGGLRERIGPRENSYRAGRSRWLAHRANAEIGERAAPDIGSHRSKQIRSFHGKNP